MKKRWLNAARLLGSILICQFAGLLGSVFTTSGSLGWYNDLFKPDFTPPDWVFAPVWTILYTLMGISLYLVWNQGLNKPMIRTSLIFFGVQLGLNVLWTLVFFGLHFITGGLIVIILLWIAIFTTIFIFSVISRAATILLLPYIAWVTYAAYLNFEIWRLNVWEY